MEKLKQTVMTVNHVNHSPQKKQQLIVESGMNLSLDKDQIKKELGIYKEKKKNENL